MNRNLLIAGVVALILIAAVVFVLGQQGTSEPQGTNEGVLQEGEVIENEAQDENTMDEDDGGQSVEVEISNFAYSPATITVSAGTTVTWTNSDSVAHTATANDGSFDTGLIEQGESVSVTFDEPGAYEYHCTPHPNMTATVIVE